MEDVSYFRWRRPKLSEAEEDLLSGVRAIHFSLRVLRSCESSQLLRKDPRTRYTLDELRMHPYFFDSKGRNVFDEILQEAAADTYGETLSFLCLLHSADIPPRQLLRRRSWMCTFQDRLPPPSYSRQFTIFTTPTVVIITSSVGSTTEEFGPAIVIHKNNNSGHFSPCFSFTLIGLFNYPPSFHPPH